MSEVREIEPEELARWRAGGVEHVLLDVRRDDELARASLDGAVHIPMHELPRRVAEIPHGKPLVVMCHTGARSWQSAHFLVHGGFPEVYNLEGGIDAYATRVDPSIPRYR
ncbi:MAG TPA: rhodanese-like domain-containing protein [Candidatus Baltobacteraceae bacterium]|nr:rhodanese-like domain-containing protein [Candidatus Baltobacteraceae bacterium]